MLYVKIENGQAVRTTTAIPRDGSTHQSRWDWKSYSEAQEIARQLNVNTPNVYIAIDAGANTAPRYDVIEAPRVGDDVSRYFNGDSYPTGTIVKVTASMQVKTSTGATFRRKRLTGAWLDRNGWAMIQGHRNERNPSF